jgi:phytoene dehydrogenase-like protein
MTKVLIIGGGHNGLVCGAYLAKAGLDVTVLEARSHVGGCASTVDALGARINICNCDHILVRSTPIIEELNLGSFGLAYRDADPVHMHLGWDNAAPWPLFHSAERTIDGLRAFYPGEVDGYRRYLKAAQPVVDLVTEMAQIVPTARQAVGKVFSKRVGAVKTLMSWNRKSASSVMSGFFSEEPLRRALMTTGPSVWGVSPHLQGTGTAAIGYALKHHVGAGRPVGGSGAFPDALRRALEAHGGSVRCDVSVAGLVLDSDGVQAVTTTTGEVIEADFIVAACDPRRVMVDWVGANAPVSVERRWKKKPAHDGYESKVDVLLRELPRYRADNERLQRLMGGVDFAAATGVISPNVDAADVAAKACADGRIVDEPPLLANYPSVIDGTLRVGTHHVLSLEALYTPYALKGGWIESGEPERWLERYSDLLEPGFLESIIDYRVVTPVDYEKDFGMSRGYAPAFSGSPLSAVFGRDQELSRYRTPVKGLFLTGAGTFPGAGVWGASGRNAAHVVIEEASRPRSPSAASMT